MNPYHTYEQPGTYVVCLTITDNTGCVDEVCHEIVVEPVGSACNASFTWEVAGGNPLEIHFHSTSTSNHDIISYQWNFGDGSTADGANPTHVYGAPGTYLVCLIITDNAGCVSDVCHEVHVGEQNEECHAAFNWELDDDDVYHFNNNSTGGTPNTTWLWTFGDGATSAEENPVHMYEEPGIYTVCLVMTDSTINCVDDVCHTFTYSLGWEELGFDGTQPERSFATSPSSGKAPSFKVIHYTNPAAESVVVEYFLPVASSVRFEIFDLTGNRMITTYSDYQTLGIQKETLDIRSFHPGMYILTVTTGTERRSLRLNVSR